MIAQDAMLRAVRDACARDPHILAAMLSGSFAQGEGDRWSDLDLALFVHDDHLADYDLGGWLARIAPVRVCSTDEHGVHQVIFAGAVRAELHLGPASRMPEVCNWPQMAEHHDVSAMRLYDPTGALQRVLVAAADDRPAEPTPEAIASLEDGFLHLFLTGWQVLRRGDRVRALDLLGRVQRSLLSLARVAERRTRRHFLTPSKAAATDLSAGACARFATCVATLADGDLERAYLRAWAWYLELVAAIRVTHGVQPRDEAIAEIGREVTSGGGALRRSAGG